MILSAFAFFSFLPLSLCYLIAWYFSLIFCFLMLYVILLLLFVILAGVWGKACCQALI